MRFYSQMCKHPFAGWFSVGGVVIGKTRVSLALTKTIFKLHRDDSTWNSWSVFLLGLRIHVIRGYEFGR